MDSARVRLYHATVPKGKVFTDPQEYYEALGTGWVDAPWKIEQVFQEDQGDELKPWQKAQAARKAKREERIKAESMKPPQEE